MSEADLKVNSKVRKILTENCLDLSLLRVSTTSGSVRIQGKLKKLSASTLSAREAVMLLGVLETVILRTTGVKRVTFSVDGWEKSKGKWKETAK